MNEHGLNYYNRYQCRCTICVLAKAQSSARWRSKLAEPCSTPDCDGVAAWAGAPCPKCRGRRYRIEVLERLHDHAATLYFYGITPAAFTATAELVPGLKAQVRVDAARLAADLTYSDPVGRLSAPPRKVYGRGRWRRNQAEWEWLDALDQQTRRALRFKLGGAGHTPDTLYQAYRCSPELGVDLFIDDALRIAGARALAAGRAPAYIEPDVVFRGESAAVQELADMGVPLESLFPEPSRRLEKRAEFVARLAAAELRMIERYG